MTRAAPNASGVLEVIFLNLHLVSITVVAESALPKCKLDVLLAIVA